MKNSTDSPSAATEQIWTRFLSGRCSGDEIENSPILRRWDRSVRLGATAEGLAEPVVVPDSQRLVALEPLKPLLTADAPFEAFASSLANAGFCGILSSADGVVLARRIAEPFSNRMTEARLIEGALWNEASRGTNGIGTAVAEHLPVAVVGFEHFEKRNHVLCCYAAPIRDVRGRVVGVLDATGPARDASEFAFASVQAAAAAMESVLRARAYDASISGGLFALEALLAKLPHAALLIETTGRVRRANEPLLRLLPRRDEPQELALLSWDGLVPTASPRLRESDAALPSWLRGVRLEVEPVSGPDGAIAAIVHLLDRPPARTSARGRAVVSQAFAAIVGSDPALMAAREHAERFARSGLPILLQAETGTGKELFARAIHAGSRRAHGPFVPVNCGSLTGTLLESELFGYSPGAFTGAAGGGRMGKLAAADQGTLFMDEVAELSPTAQAMLLRFLDDGTYYRVGEAEERHSDVRLIAATCRDLTPMLADGRFRSDLFYRLRGVTIGLPALRERSDRRELTEAILAGFARRNEQTHALAVSPAAARWVDHHSWPGNVRELRSALEYAAVLAEGASRIERWHLPIEAEPARAGELEGLRTAAERSALQRALDRANGNMSDAARQLGVARSTLYRMLDRFGLRRTDELPRLETEPAPAEAPAPGPLTNLSA
ncbi:MAG: sigma-54-dependent Fis family transcriptional regulator [Candidatus Eisenbacteria bacterium]|uniref:Sigma-54-dependent Fis family transcriptional regulator n=1 Tax=Eiseniibacteriota bacterium TaxID=2212470 RepID=A0A849SKN4_UNCEI|nr:sigma-54-dependent Fis family transcriptional regulator [Candidatus Eisenbacteria bacterium]